MKQFLIRLFCFFIIGGFPFLLLSTGYWYYDPFKVLRSYNDYSYPYVIPNRDHVSTQVFIKNNPTCHYNAFIFGSSRTLAFKPTSWQKYLSLTDHPFIFDASGESIFGIYTKLKYLDSLQVPLDHVIILLCRDVSFKHTSNQTGHLFIKHPAVSGDSWFDFQFTFFKAYLSIKFLYAFYDYTFTHIYKPHMEGYIEKRKITFDPMSNEIAILDQEQEITQDSVHYYIKRATLFYERTEETTDSVQRINSQSLAMLNNIKNVLEKNKSDYKIILSPLYEQVKFNPTDKAILSSLFENHLYDFSGQNSFTTAKTNYYENSHFRPFVGDQILQAIYKK